MELEDLVPWAEAFAAFRARLDDLFVRSESRQQLHTFLRGLIAPPECKTSQQLAELVQAMISDCMHRLLYQEPWDAGAARPNGREPF